MLFNSFQFILVFLPLAFVAAVAMQRFMPTQAVAALAVASLAFYAVWNFRHLLLLLASALFNYLVGRFIANARFQSAHHEAAKRVLVLAIIANLALLGYYKYFNFFATAASEVFGFRYELANIVLPLGISFFTFTQIAFLVDVYKGVTRESKFSNYLLFVAYFPHLIAGPILHHKEMVPQFVRPRAFAPDVTNISMGLSVFTIGLFKKVVVADTWAVYADQVFGAALHGQSPMFFDAWIGALAYTVQLYFDFSGYCDMAVGMSLLFNVRLPQNFNSPYKATSIIDFWQRWHMTLSAFLRDYLYIPLGGNRHGTIRRYVNLMVTMLLGGLWHGAGWTFVAWGALHGFYLVINHAWRALQGRFAGPAERRRWPLVTGAATFLAVVAAWVVFRSDSVAQARAMWMGMAGLNGIPGLTGRVHTPMTSITNVQPHEWLIFVVIWCFPNLMEIFDGRGGVVLGNDGRTVASHAQRTSRWLRWQPSMGWAISLGLLFFASLMKINSDGASSFLYFQF